MAMKMIGKMWKPQRKEAGMYPRASSGWCDSILLCVSCLVAAQLAQRAGNLANTTEDKVKSFMQGLFPHMFFRVYVNGGFS